MLDQQNATPTPHKRLPWNKGKLTGAKPPLRPRLVNPDETPDRRPRSRPCFVQSTASFVGVMSSPSGSRMSLAGGYMADRATVRVIPAAQPFAGPRPFLRSSPSRSV
jgi:hypothetical protein